MGSQRAREITRQIERLRDIENRTQYEFKRLKESIKFQGASDFEMKKATIFRENYIKEMEKYKKNDPLIFIKNNLDLSEATYDRVISLKKDEKLSMQ